MRSCVSRFVSLNLRFVPSSQPYLFHDRTRLDVYVRIVLSTISLDACSRHEMQNHALSYPSRSVLAQLDALTGA